jgi:protocatechuate 4,5-dioxygenase, alpha chain
MSTNSIALDLEAPGTLVFTAELALAGHRLNRCALSLKSAASRAEFQADPDGYMRRFGLGEAERALVQARDWTGLLRAGGHVQAILFFAATMGETLVHIGAHNAGMAPDELLSICPRRTGGLPPSVTARKEIA